MDGNRPEETRPTTTRARRRRFTGRRMLTGVLAFGLATVVVVREVPFYLPHLPDAAPPVPEERQLVFGYATLANPVVRTVVTGRWHRTSTAEIEGVERIGRNLVPLPEGRVEGRVFSVGPQELRRLDRFEQTGLRYERDLVGLDDGREAWVYRMISIPTLGAEAQAAGP